ncbi:glutathionine S-transferase [Nitzschia inconspicua]|uniref:Glutathionine S-transferase n=1 Tax=Nitzschia inconspicua TaxID=303405 RepID=A0A9K3KVP0_9STRA|nr:glutathionine S-transferase [Nitzschia inconspicua]
MSQFGGSTIGNNSNEPYTLPKVWKWENPDPESINQPTAGFRTVKSLPVGKHPLQLYSLATPNGQKVTILLEELLEAGIASAEYDAWLINIMKKDQFTSGFVDVNPNSKIPALVDKSVEGKEVKVFESGSILLYLAEKFDAFLPKDFTKRTQAMNWLFWNVGSAPYLGNFGHFYHYAHEKQRYPIDRFTMETKRLLDVLNRHLEKNEYLAGDEYSIADIANYPWYSGLVLGKSYAGSDTFLNAKEEYPHVIRWAETISKRPAVKRGEMVNKTWGSPSEQLSERHDASDFQKKTEEAS